MFKYQIKSSDILPEVKIVTPDTFEDYRGEMWTYWEQSYDLLPNGYDFKISKFTRSRKNVLRGLHGDNFTWKHITCVSGELYLVVVDYRPESINYLKWESFLLNDRNHKSILVPENFLNGHLCLSDECVFHYTQSYPKKYVDVEEQTTVRYDDERIKIHWPINKPILSERDK